MSSKQRKSGSGPSIGGLADALVKAGVASEQQASSARPEKGRGERRDGRGERRGGRGQAERRDRPQGPIDDTPHDVATIDGLHKLIREHNESGGGNRRWFFVARDGRIPFVDVSDAVARKLEEGRAGVVESMGAARGEHVVVGDARTLATLAQHEAELVRFWNRPRKG